MEPLQPVTAKKPPHPLRPDEVGPEDGHSTLMCPRSGQKVAMVAKSA
jgi:hypothetical protein